MIYLVPGTSLDRIHTILDGVYPIQDRVFLDFLFKQLDEVSNDNRSEEASEESGVHR